MTKRFCTFAAAVFALLALTAPARAATITWYLNGAPESSGGFPEFQDETITGVLDWNTVTNTPTAWSFVGKGATNFTNGPCTFATCYSLVFPLFVSFGGITLDSFSPDHVFYYGPSALDGPASLLFFGGVLHLAASDTIFGGLGPPVTLGEQISGTLSDTPPAVPAVPLPPALPLFGSALLALVGFAWWRRGKVSA